jgi:CRISPR system Cascade subunit CasC
MNSAEYSAGVFYRFASIDLGDLQKNTGDTADTRELAAAFLNAFISSLPEGKKTSTAAWTVPDLVYVTVRSDRPLSLAAAFEKPVRSRSGWSEPSCKALAGYASKIHRLTGRNSLLHEAHAGIADEPFAELGDQSPGFHELIAAAVDIACPSAGERP